METGLGVRLSWRLWKEMDGERDMNVVATRGPGGICTAGRIEDGRVSPVPSWRFSSSRA